LRKPRQAAGRKAFASNHPGSECASLRALQTHHMCRSMCTNTLLHSQTLTHMRSPCSNFAQTIQAIRSEPYLARSVTLRLSVLPFIAHVRHTYRLALYFGFYLAPSLSLSPSPSLFLRGVRDSHRLGGHSSSPPSPRVGVVSRSVGSVVLRSRSPRVERRRSSLYICIHFKMSLIRFKERCDRMRMREMSGPSQPTSQR
jgi:hypothetical protein